MKIIGRASAVNLELDAGGIVNVFTTAAIAVPFDQTNVEVVDNDGHHRYLIELAEVTSYTPEGGVETVFSGTRDQLIDILNEQFFTGGTGAGGGFTPTTDVLQSQIVNFNIDTVANAKALTYELNDRVYIEELDEVFQAKSVPSGITATGSPTQVGTDLYTISHNANTYGQILRIDAQGNLYNDYQFTAAGAVGNKPVGTLLYANGLLYIETTEGGANNLGTLMTFNPLTKAVSKVLDFSNTLGYSQGVLTPLQNNDKVLVDTDKLYLITGDGGANNKGTILNVDLATNTASVILDLNTTGIGVTTSKGFAVAVSGVYYAFVEDQAIKVDIATDTVTSLHVEGTIVGNGKALSVGFYDSSVNTVYLGFDGDSGGLASYDIATDTYTYKTSSTQPDTYVIFKDGNIIYGLEAVTGNLYGWDLVANTLLPSTAHTFPSPQVLNGSFNASTGILYFTQGTSYLTQDKIYKYDVATQTTTLIKDLSIGGVTGDDQFIISVNQAGFYLQVRDNHIKSISTANGLATVTSTRNGTSTFNYSSGFIDYNDSSAAVTLVANTWTDVPNDGAGGSSLDTYKPSGVNDILDTSTGYFDFSDLELGDEVFLRIDFSVTPNLNNALLECRMDLGGGVYQLDVFSKRLDNGAGISYPSEKFTFYMYMGNLTTINGTGKLQVRLSSGGSLDNAGVAISIIKK